MPIPNPSRVRLRTFAEEAAGSIPAGSMVLDAGAGSGPYSEFFAPHTYHACDHLTPKRHGSAFFRSSLDAIPVRPDTYDLVFCSQVLEHVPDPAATMHEIGRVLRPGGTVWLTTPLMFPEHQQPHDYFRYTQFGLQLLCDRAGLEVTRLEPLEGYFANLSQQLIHAEQALNQVLEMAPDQQQHADLMELALKRFTGLADAFARADLREMRTDIGSPKNYVLVAQAPT